MNESQKKKKITCMEDVRSLPQGEQLKYEIAEELGIVDKVFQSGWRSLSAKESGRIGGIMRSRKKRNASGKTQSPSSISTSAAADKENE